VTRRQKVATEKKERRRGEDPGQGLDQARRRVRPIGDRSDLLRRGYL
jgi:hypothetical protein